MIVPGHDSLMLLHPHVSAQLSKSRLESRLISPELERPYDISIK